MTALLASAPAKAILFGEHAVNRGASAIAVSVGLRTTCRVAAGGTAIVLRSGARARTASRADVLALASRADDLRGGEDFAGIRRMVAGDFFAPTLYVLAGLGAQLPAGLDIDFTSEVPETGGLGSGGASFAALSAALAELSGAQDRLTQAAAWALRGDQLAHGGIASGLDTQTSLRGGVIRYTRAHGGQSLSCAPGLDLVIGDTGIRAATSDVNGRVRAWLAADSVRMHYFAEIGALARQAEDALAVGDWPALGHLINLNQLVLERIGVSCEPLERLIHAALGAGALGAKLAGSGGGGIMLALVTPDVKDRVAHAITQAGGRAIVAPIGAPGVTVTKEQSQHA